MKTRQRKKNLKKLMDELFGEVKINPHIDKAYFRLEGLFRPAYLRVMKRKRAARERDNKKNISTCFSFTPPPNSFLKDLTSPETCDTVTPQEDNSPPEIVADSKKTPPT